MYLRPLLSTLCLAGVLGTGHAQTAQTAQVAPADAASAGVSDDLPRLQWMGFGTLGYAQVSSGQLRSFARDPTQDVPSSFGVDSRLGLQLNTQLSARWAATAQLVAAQRASEAPLSESVEWAFASFRPAEGWLMRAGRTSPDIFLHADVRNVGFAWPWVRPSQEFYAWMPMKSMDGLDLSRLWTDEGGLWHLKVAVGQAKATTVGQTGGGAVVSIARDLLTLTLRREAGPWTWKLSYLQGKLDLSAIDGLQQLQDGLSSLAALPVPGLAEEVALLKQVVPVVSRIHYFALGAQYDQGPWLIHAEHSWQGGAARQAPGRHAYVSVAHRWDPVTAYVIAGNSHLNQPALQSPADWVARLTPYLGPQGAAQASALAQVTVDAGNGVRFSQRSIGLGLRWDLSPTWSLKTQLDRVHVNQDGASQWHRVSNAAANTSVFSASLDFVF